MGTWSHHSFGNDDACDWAFDLEKTADLHFIESTLDSVLDIGPEYLESFEATLAIAASETIARLQGNFGIQDSYSKPVDDWVSKYKLTPPSQLAQKATQALNRVLQEPSELLELWQESGEVDLWIGAIKELQSRIRA